MAHESEREKSSSKSTAADDVVETEAAEAAEAVAAEVDEPTPEDRERRSRRSARSARPAKRATSGSSDPAESSESSESSERGGPEVAAELLTEAGAGADAEAGADADADVDGPHALPARNGSSAGASHLDGPSQNGTGATRTAEIDVEPDEEDAEGPSLVKRLIPVIGVAVALALIAAWLHRRHHG